VPRSTTWRARCKRAARGITRRRGLAGGRLPWRLYRRGCRGLQRRRARRGQRQGRQASGDIDDLAAIQDFAVAWLRREQDLDLQSFGVAFDVFFLESSLYESGEVDAAR
jgi:hypothetical protein